MKDTAGLVRPIERAEDWMEGTLLVRHWEAVKRDILLHKWYESERAGRDIGWERASVDWLCRYGHRARPGELIR